MKTNTKPQMAKGAIVNGVNVSQLGETIEAIQQNPSIAEFCFRAKNSWLDGGHNRIEINQFMGACAEQSRQKPFVFDADEPPVLLGNDQGANPVEYVLTALSSCLTTALVYHAAAHGIEIESLQSRFEGDLDLHGFLGLNPDVRKGYKEIRAEFRVKSDAEVKKLEELMMMSPVFDIVRNPTPVNIKIIKD